LKSGTAQLKERGPGRRPDGGMMDKPHRRSNFVNAVSRTTYFSKLQLIPEPSTVAQNYKVGLQGGQIKTGTLSSTVQMLRACQPIRLCSYRMLPEFIGIWQNVLLTALTEF